MNLLAKYAVYAILQTNATNATNAITCKALQILKTLMSQDFIDIECNVAESFTENSVQTFTANELAEQLSVSVRSVYGYANKLIDCWHWLPESEFRSDGIYSHKALDEMRRMKKAKSFADYCQMVARENQKPLLQAKTTATAIAPVRHTEQLEIKLATIQKNTTALNVSVQDRITTIKGRIATEANRTKTNQTVLDELEAQTQPQSQPQPTLQSLPQDDIPQNEDPVIKRLSAFLEDF